MPRLTHRSRPSIRFIVTLMVTLPIVAVSAALVTISTLAGSSVAEELGNEIVQRSTARVQSGVRDYLSASVRLSDLYARRIASGTLSTQKLDTWTRTMLDDLVTNPDVASICFANVAGDATYLMRARGRLEVGYSSGTAEGNNTRDFVIEASGKIAPEPFNVYRYDARSRPWYTTAEVSNDPVWTPIYYWFPEERPDREIGAGYTRAIRDAEGNLLGVLVIDVTLQALSDFLRRSPLGERGSVFIVDTEGSLVAGSRGYINTADGKRRIKLHELDVPAAQAVSRAIQGDGHSRRMNIAGIQKVDIDGLPARVMVAQVAPYVGINWRMISVLPEDAFMADARATQFRSIIFALGAMIGAIILGFSLSRRISMPLIRLKDYVSRLSGGDFESRIELRSARELDILSDELNRMAGGLKHRMELQQAINLATAVQQSLLPAEAPKTRGLEVMGLSHYCDSTGGDYFDFVEVTDMPSNEMLIAVGDVTGHGIGAALLMATARAALRATAIGAAPLPDLMQRINRVISDDTRHGLYMTMVLIAVDPTNRKVRWVSAGQDPVIVFDPQLNTFFELDDGDIPLGIERDFPYVEFRREGLSRGSILFIGTDGVWEARNEQQEMYGKARLKELIAANSQKTVEEISKAIEESLASFRGNSPVRDDITYVIARIQ